MKQNVNVAKVETVKDLLKQENIKKRFHDVLGDNAPGFISSIISAMSLNPDLNECEPMSIVAAAGIAASFDLPVNPSLGFAYMIPYNETQKDGGGKIKMARFQMGYRGYIQLGMRTGQYKTINAALVYDGELVEYNRFTGDMVFDETARASNKIIGYLSYFRLLNGFEKYFYMTVEQVKEHGQKYAPGYNNVKSIWQKDFNAMGLKTVTKANFSKYGILTIKMEKAIAEDAEFTLLNSTVQHQDQKKIGAPGAVPQYKQLASKLATADQQEQVDNVIERAQGDKKKAELRDYIDVVLASDYKQPGVAHLTIDQCNTLLNDLKGRLK